MHTIYSCIKQNKAFNHNLSFIFIRLPLISGTAALKSCRSRYFFQLFLSATQKKNDSNKWQSNKSFELLNHLPVKILYICFRLFLKKNTSAHVNETHYRYRMTNEGDHTQHKQGNIYSYLVCFLRSANMIFLKNGWRIIFRNKCLCLWPYLPVGALCIYCRFYSEHQCM